jgi:hypothetical protein
LQSAAGIFPPFIRFANCVDTFAYYLLKVKFQLSHAAYPRCLRTHYIGQQEKSRFATACRADHEGVHVTLVYDGGGLFEAGVLSHDDALAARQILALPPELWREGDHAVGLLHLLGRSEAGCAVLAVARGPAFDIAETRAVGQPLRPGQQEQQPAPGED